MSRAGLWFALAWLGFVALTGCRNSPPIERGPPAQAPSRVVSQTVLSDEILWDLGPAIRHRVVGVSVMADDPRYSTVDALWPPEVQRVAGSSEALLASASDLVIMAGFTAAETQALVKAAGVPTLVLRGFDGFSDYREHVRDIARALGDAQAGQRLIATFDARLAGLRGGTSTLGCISTQDGNVAGSGTTFDDEAKAAGLRNLAAEHGVVGHVAVPLEQIVVWNPDIIVTACADDCAAVAERLATAPGWSSTAAARTGRVVAIPGRFLYATGRGMLDAVEHLRRIEVQAP